MTKTINSDLIRGNINTIILKALFNADRYGYDIIKDIEEKSHGQYILKQPTLYSCLKRLESQGFITSYWSGEQSNGGRRKYYSLTEMGREVFVQSQDEYEYSRTIIDQLISDKSYNLDDVEKPLHVDDDSVEEFNAEPDFEDIAVTDAPVVADETVEASDEAVVAVEETVVEGYDVPADVAPESCAEITDEALFAEIDKIIEGSNEAETHPEESSAADEIIAEDSASSPSSILDSLLSDDSENSYSGNVVSESIDATESRRSAEANYFVNAGYSLDSAFKLDEPTPPMPSYDFATATFSEDLFPPESKTYNPEPVAEHSYASEFLSYNTPLPPKHDAVADEYKKPSASQYRSVLGGLIDGFENDAEQPNTAALKKEEIIAESTLSVKEKIKVRNFGKLTDSIRELGDDVKIRTPDSNAVHAYNQQYLYYRNKLALFQYGMLFAIMLIESFLTFIIIKSAVRINTDYDVIMYIGAILISVALPIIAGANYLSDPFKRKRADFNLKSSMIFRVIIMLQLMLITYAFNVYLGMPISCSKEYLLPMLLPMILSTNVPVSGVLFNLLYKSKKFAVE